MINVDIVLVINMNGNKKEMSEGVKLRTTNFGKKLSDNVARFGGSWTFIIIFLSFLVIWIIINKAWANSWDPYPFILLNLVLSCIAALQAPIILMSQNRAAERDRIKAERDYYVNRKSEREIEDMQKDLDEIKKMINNIHLNLRK